MQIIISVLIPGLGVWCRCVTFIMFYNILRRVLCLNQIFFKIKKKKVNGWMISRQLLMFKPRTRHCASLKGGVRGSDLLMHFSWQGQFLYIWAWGHNSDSSFPFRDSTGERGGNKAAGKESRSDLATPDHYKRCLNCTLVRHGRRNIAPSTVAAESHPGTRAPPDLMPHAFMF